jgi:hypothetical protein
MTYSSRQALGFSFLEDTAPPRPLESAQHGGDEGQGALFASHQAPELFRRLLGQTPRFGVLERRDRHTSELESLPELPPDS